MNGERPSIALAARVLRDASRDGIARLAGPVMLRTVGEAYRVQDANTAGERRVGWKIALTNQAALDRFQCTEPCRGTLLASMQIPNGGILRAAGGRACRVEAEIAFRMGRDVGPKELSSPNALRSAIDSVVPALEIVSSRYSSGPADAIELIADNASAHRFVLGEPVRYPPEFEPASMHARVERNGAFECEGPGSEVMGDPLNALSWLAGFLIAAERKLEAGEVILAGSVTTPFAAGPGDRIKASISGLGSVSCVFEEAT